jgi:hypothetical protein
MLCQNRFSSIDLGLEYMMTFRLLYGSLLWKLNAAADRPVTVLLQRQTELIQETTNKSVFSFEGLSR